MIITKILGGLGNQMFQYAVGRSLSERLGVELKLDVSGFEGHELREYCLNVFNIKEVFATKEELEEIAMTNVKHHVISRLFPNSSKYSTSYLKEKPLFKFNRHFLSLTDNTVLEGYWQNEKYFKDFSSLIKDDFSLKNPMSSKSIEVERVIKNCNSVGLHIRRGDYANDKKLSSQLGLCSLEYYKNAIELLVKEIGEDLRFFIFSDEPEWAKENLEISYHTVVVDHNGADKGFEDMMLMSACKHQIIANSSFSWWAAWLNDNTEKVVAAPKVWFTDTKYDTSELIPKDWIRV